MSPQQPRAKSPQIAMIWAQTTAGVIGNAGTMPWHLPEDLQHFQRITRGHPVIMGRRTWESFPEKYRPLPDRTNIVLTAQVNLPLRDAVESSGGFIATADTLEQSFTQALDYAASQPGGDQIWIIGGGKVYAQALPLAHLAVITQIDAELPGDTYAPQLDEQWILDRVEPTDGWSTSRTGLPYRFTWWSQGIEIPVD